jgi:uncharacterized protein YcbK (DUF882 family)
VLNWEKYINFSQSEFDCKCCGKLGEKMDPEFLDKIQELRTRVGFACKVNSGVRCEVNNLMSNGHKSSAHLTGNACDLGVSHSKAREVIKIAIELGLSVGVSQNGKTGKAGRFIHLDNKPRSSGEPALFSYA